MRWAPSSRTRVIHWTCVDPAPPHRALVVSLASWSERRPQNRLPAPLGSGCFWLGLPRAPPPPQKNPLDIFPESASVQSNCPPPSVPPFDVFVPFLNRSRIVIRYSPNPDIRYLPCSSGRDRRGSSQTSGTLLSAPPLRRRIHGPVPPLPRYFTFPRTYRRNGYAAIAMKTGSRTVCGGGTHVERSKQNAPSAVGAVELTMRIDI